MTAPMTSTISPLDPTGLALVRALATDGRASYQSLAEKVGLSRPAVMERVKRLEEQGVITGYATLLDRARIGRPITAFVTVRYPASDHVGTEPWIRKLAEHPDILECHHVAGEDCYILKVAVPSIDRLEGVLRALRPRGEPATTRTTIVLSTVFEKVGVLPPLASDTGEEAAGG
jgi:Lrp/AsnC family leucine-responsive transcriptional regulator